MWLRPHYYESCIVARNLKHERASKVKLAFAKAYNMPPGSETSRPLSRLSLEVP